jgi:plasmid maintenance system antidote protein VapI
MINHVTRIQHKYDWVSMILLSGIFGSILYFIDSLLYVELLEDYKSENTLWGWISYVLSCIFFLAINGVGILLAFFTVKSILTEEWSEFKLENDLLSLKSRFSDGEIREQDYKLDNPIKFVIRDDDNASTFIEAEELKNPRERLTYIINGNKYFSEDDIYRLRSMMADNKMVTFDRKNYVGGLTNMIFDVLMNKRGLIGEKMIESVNSIKCDFCGETITENLAECQTCGKSQIGNYKKVFANLIYRLLHPKNILIIFLSILAGLFSVKFMVFIWAAFLLGYLNKTNEFLHDLFKSNQISEYFENRKWTRVWVLSYMVLLVVLAVTNPKESDLQEYVIELSSNEAAELIGSDNEIASAIISSAIDLSGATTFIERNNYILFSTFHLDIPLLDDKYTKIYGFGNTFIYPELSKELIVNSSN